MPHFLIDPFVVKRFLQIAVCCGACVPIGAGLAGVIQGPTLIDAVYATTHSLDSHFRYLSGILFALGLCFLTTVPKIEQQSERFSLLCILVILGGLARLWSLIEVGLPGQGMIFGMWMELIVVPILVLIQQWLARQLITQR